MGNNPYSEAQRAILSIVLNLGNEAMDVAYRYIEERHFTELRYRMAWRAIMWLYENNHEINEITVQNSMLVTRDKSGQVAFDLLDPHGGKHSEELMAIKEFRKQENVSHLNSYIDIILDKFKTEKYLDMAQRLMDKGMNGKATAGQLQAIVNDFAAFFSEKDRKQPSSLQEIANVMIEKNLSSPEGDQSIIHPDIPMIDNFVWLTPGNQTIIAGDTGHGKTSLALQIAWNIAKQKRKIINQDTGRPIIGDDGQEKWENRRILFFSLEMSEAELLTKLCCIENNITVKSFMVDMKPKERIVMLSKFKELLARVAPNFLIDCNVENIKQLINKANMVSGNHGVIDLLVVDYLQLLKEAKQAGEREDEVYRDISRQLKKLATRIGCHTMPLSQLNKATQDKTGAINHRPTLDRLFGSSAMKQDASHVIFVYREWAVNVKNTILNGETLSTLYISRILLEKHRFGHNQVEIVCGFIPYMTYFVPIQVMRNMDLLKSKDPNVKFPKLIEFSKPKEKESHDEGKSDSGCSAANNQ